tara:strand:- start:252 stop:617 length:366 start_codon:yes stop_codon:yes gene_type:complete
MTLEGTNSKFYCSGWFTANDDDSSNFGVGIGYYVAKNSGTGPDSHYLKYPGTYDNQSVVQSDKYWQIASSIYYADTYTAGASVTFRLYGRFSYANAITGATSGGSETPQSSVSLVVMEIAG